MAILSILGFMPRLDGVWQILRWSELSGPGDAPPLRGPPPMVGHTGATVDARRVTAPAPVKGMG